MYNKFKQVDMVKCPHLNTIINYILVMFFSLGVMHPAFAAYGKTKNHGYLQKNSVSEVKKGTTYVVTERGVSKSEKGKLLLSSMQKQARAYRIQGLSYQLKGNLAAALRSYQRALQFDPAYVEAFNDLGIVYEASGSTDKAIECYLKSIESDPDYLSAYSNLAMLYEEQRDFDKALFYWNKRMALSTTSDEWSQKAKERIRDIKMVQGMFKPKPTEDELLDLVKEVSKRKEALSDDKQKFAQHLLDKAKLSYKNNDDVAAYKKASDAQLLDPSNKEIDDFLQKVQSEMLVK